jgi:hypothetical protein
MLLRQNDEVACYEKIRHLQRQAVHDATTSFNRNEGMHNYPGGASVKYDAFFRFTRQNSATQSRLSSSLNFDPVRYCAWHEPSRLSVHLS